MLESLQSTSFRQLGRELFGVVAEMRSVLVVVVHLATVAVEVDVPSARSLRFQHGNDRLTWKRDRFSDALPALAIGYRTRDVLLVGQMEGAVVGRQSAAGVLAVARYVQAEVGLLHDGFTALGIVQDAAANNAAAADARPAVCYRQLVLLLHGAQRYRRRRGDRV